MERLATTPFGGAPMRAQIFAHQARVEKRQQALKDGKGGNDTGTADKWQLIRALTEAREAFGLSDRTITVLEALVSFHTDRVLDGSNAIIVFPSNGELSLRTRGMAPATIRRHIAQLVETGLVIRRDSPNGKRFCRRDDRGQVEDAFGFDLAPLALAASEIHAAADAARAEIKAVQKLRAEITIHLRDISKIIEAALEERRSGDWLALADRLASVSGRIGRNTERNRLEVRRDGLVELRKEVEDLYLSGLSEQEVSGNDADYERHIQNSNTDLTSEYNGLEQHTAGAATPADKPAPEVKSVGIGLKQFLTACPQIADYAKGGVRTWRDAIEAAGVVRSTLGVSVDAWDKARAAMGDVAAAIVIAAILERANDIRSPGGYLRDLTRKAEAGRFSVIPMIKALGG